MSNPYATNEYRCKLLRVVDGDTLQLEVDLGLRVRRELYIRITGCYAPETKGPLAHLGRAAAEYAAVIMQSFADADCGDILVRFSKGKSFDRWLGKVVLRQPDGVELNFGHEMIKAGHAKACAD